MTRKMKRAVRIFWNEWKLPLGALLVLCVVAALFGCAAPTIEVARAVLA